MVSKRLYKSKVYHWSKYTFESGNLSKRPSLLDKLSSRVNVDVKLRVSDVPHNAEKVERKRNKLTQRERKLNLGTAIERL